MNIYSGENRRLAIGYWQIKMPWKNINLNNYARKKHFND